MRNFILPVIVVLLSFPSLRARADWEGDIEARMQGNDTAQMKGKIRMKAGKTRMDMTSPIPVSTIIDVKKRKGWALLHEQKLAMVSDFEKSKQQIPMCGSGNVDRCLKEKGFKKTGSATFDGHLCAIYEDAPASADSPAHTMIYRPVDMKEVPSVRTLATGEDGKVVETTIKGIKLIPQDEKYFTVPANYQNMGDMGEVMKTIKSGKYPGAPR